ncbi:conserved hypothetical protein [Pseudomonas veronii]|nr:conserved hypothetical protein [Pseudomonas veronii]
MMKRKSKKELSEADERFYRSATHVMAMLSMFAVLTAVFVGMVLVFAPAFKAASDVTSIIVILCAQVSVICGMKIIGQWTYWAGAQIGLRIAGIKSDLPMPDCMPSATGRTE